MQNHTIDKKIGDKSAIKHKDGVQDQKWSKKIGCKITQKKEGSAQFAKDKGEKCN